MRCVRCNRETSDGLTVAGRVIGPTCFKKMFPELVKSRKTKVIHQEQLGFFPILSGEFMPENIEKGEYMNAEHYEKQNAHQVKEAIKTLIRADVDEGIIKTYDMSAATIALSVRVLSELCEELGFDFQRLKKEAKND